MACPVFCNIPKNKLTLKLEDIDEKIKDPEASKKVKDMVHRYYEANIPVKYWSIDMKNFSGDPRLLTWFNECAEDITKIYKLGPSVCLAGSFGIGKTLAVTNILKQALAKGYSSLYVTLEDIITAVRSKAYFEARQELLTINFLVIDELDPRYMATDASADFHGRLLESVLRHRTGNKLPLFLCTNAISVEESFSGSIKQAISSLFNYVDVFPVLGQDYRKQEKI